MSTPRPCCAHPESDHFSWTGGSFCKKCSPENWEHVFAEGVAAPLEPTPQDFYDTWHPKKSFAYRSIEEYWFEFSKAYAAAVSKNLQEELARATARADKAEQAIVEFCSKAIAEKL